MRSKLRVRADFEQTTSLVTRRVLTTRPNSQKWGSKGTCSSVGTQVGTQRVQGTLIVSVSPPFIPDSSAQRVMAKVKDK